MATELKKFELLPSMEKARRPLQHDRSSLTTTTYQSSMTANVEALRLEARSLFVRFAVRWCRANSAGLGRKEAA